MGQTKNPEPCSWLSRAGVWAGTWFHRPTAWSLLGRLAPNVITSARWHLISGIFWLNLSIFIHVDGTTRKRKGSHFLSYLQLQFPCLPLVLSGSLSLAFFFSFCDKCVYSGIRVWTVVFVPSLSLARHSWRHTKSGLITQVFPVCPGLRLAARTQTREEERERRKEKRKQSMNWYRHVERQRHILGCSKFSMWL